MGAVRKLPVDTNPGGSDTQVQFNDGGAFGGDASLLWDKTSNFLSVPEIRALDANGLKLCDDGGNGIFVEDGGNVGIGTTGPSRQLVVSGNSALFELIKANAAANQGRWTFDAGSTNGTLYFQNMNDAENYGVTWLQAVRSGTTVSSVSIPNGNVGIGTTGPDRKLDILDAANPQQRWTHTDGSVYAEAQVDAAGDLYFTSTGGYIAFGSHVAIGAESLSGYITIRDAGGTLRKIGVIS